MTIRIARALLGLLGLAIVHCAGPHVAPGGSSRERIDAWLLCHDCTDGELDSLRADGRAHAAVVESLSTDLLLGPSPGRRANIGQQLEQSYAVDTAYEIAAGLVPDMTLPDYVTRFTDNYVAVYRAHAGIALAAVGGARAKTALDSAVSGQLRPGSDPIRVDAGEAIKAARDTLWAP
jgi:hypothetical protein